MARSGPRQFRWPPQVRGGTNRTGRRRGIMNSKDNERKACDAVLTVLEQRSGHRRADLGFPE